MDDKQATELVWAAWLGGTVASFAVLETRALLTGRKTLTQQVRRWLGLDPRAAWCLYACSAFGSFVVWTLVHFFTGRWNIWFLIPKSRRAAIHGIEE